MGLLCLLAAAYIKNLNIFVPVNIYQFKVHNRSARKKVWNMFKVNYENNERRQWLNNYI